MDKKEYPYIYVWENSPCRKQFKGKRCRIAWRGRLNTVRLEFEDGTELITSEYSIRKAK